MWIEWLKVLLPDLLDMLIVESFLFSFGLEVVIGELDNPFECLVTNVICHSKTVIKFSFRAI